MYRLSLKAACIAFVVLISPLSLLSANAVLSCRIVVTDVNSTELVSYTASRGQNFGGRIVRKIKSCSVCWKGGRQLGVTPQYCGINGNSGDKYTITCIRNRGQDEFKPYDCP